MKVPGAWSGDSVHGRSAHAGGASSSSSVQKVGPPLKVKGKIRVEVVMPPSSKTKGKRKAVPSKSPSPTVSSFVEPPADAPPTAPEAPTVASSSARPHVCLDRTIPVPPAQSSVLKVQWTQA